MGILQISLQRSLICMSFRNTVVSINTSTLHIKEIKMNMFQAALRKILPLILSNTFLRD